MSQDTSNVAKQDARARARFGTVDRYTGDEMIGGDEHERSSMVEEDDARTKYTVYVEGIPYGADEGDLNAHFSACGVIKSIRLPRYNDSGKLRGYGHVAFETEEAYEAALKLDGEYLKDRYLKISASQASKFAKSAMEQKVKVVKGCKTVFLKNLDYEIDEETIREALTPCGSILDVRLPMWHHTKKKKGFAYVEFTTEASACAAVKRSGMKLGGRMILINLEHGIPKASFRQSNGQYWKRPEGCKKRRKVE